jgi:hypothetical protein
MSAEKERSEILDMIQRGTINAQEGLRLIETLEESEEALDEEYTRAKASLEGRVSPEAISDPILDELDEWRKWWIIPFSIGVGLTVTGGGLMYWAWSVSRFGVGFFLSWIPFLLGIGLSALGWNSQTGPWLHLRIRQKPGESPERIAFSLPLPIQFFSWCLRTFGKFSSRVDHTGIEDILANLGDKSRTDPLSIDIADGEDGEQVTILIQ